MTLVSDGVAGAQIGFGSRRHPLRGLFWKTSVPSFFLFTISKPNMATLVGTPVTFARSGRTAPNVFLKVRPV
jgi:hypothetical protein